LTGTAILEQYREAYLAPGRPRPHYDTILSTLHQMDPADIHAQTLDVVNRRGISFRGQPLAIDIVPRFVSKNDWELICAGAVQRVRALNAFVIDAYGDQTAVTAGVLPRSVIETSRGYEPRLRGRWPQQCAPISVAGLDVVRDAAGRYLVMEDNVRCPVGFAYAEAAGAVARDVAPALLTGDHWDAHSFSRELRQVSRAAAPSTDHEPVVVVLTDGDASAVAFEDRAIAFGIGARTAQRKDLLLKGGEICLRNETSDLLRVDVIFRRDSEEMQRAPRPGHDVGNLLMEPWLKGRLGLINGLGSAVAGDKLIYAFVPALIRHFLAEEPILRSLPTHDLADPGGVRAVEANISKYVLKPRFGEAGSGVSIYAYASHRQKQAAKTGLRTLEPNYVAQQFQALSTHPTVGEETAIERCIDLRPFVLASAGDLACAAGALTRFGSDANQPLLNFSHGAGVKPTWIAADSALEPEPHLAVRI
jgi:uncharacterized circularly permuted ATP-grasp superfamily protein